MDPGQPLDTRQESLDMRCALWEIMSTMHDLNANAHLKSHLAFGLRLKHMYLRLYLNIVIVSTAWVAMC